MACAPVFDAVRTRNPLKSRARRRRGRSRAVLTSPMTEAC